ncbi:TPA: type II toxin-antitoxin system HicB family antitoxin [Serratia marcescens]
MKFPIYLHQSESGDFSGFVPDLPGCYFAGDTIDDAIADAYNAIDGYMEFLSEKGAAIPQAMTVNDHRDDEDCKGGSWAYIDIDVTKFEGKAVKLNITLPNFLLSRIDDYVKDHHQEYSSRSGFLAELARRELLKHA